MSQDAKVPGWTVRRNASCEKSKAVGEQIDWRAHVPPQLVATRVVFKVDPEWIPTVLEQVGILAGGFLLSAGSWPARSCDVSQGTLG